MHGDVPHGAPAAVCLQRGRTRAVWKPSSDLVSTTGPFVRVHGPGVGEPGILIPASSRVIHGPARGGVTGSYKPLPVRPGRHRLLFLGKSIPGVSVRLPAPGLAQQAQGIVVAAALVGRYTRQSANEYRFPRLPVRELQDGSSIEHVAGDSIVRPSGILASVLSRIDGRGDIPASVWAAGRCFTEGFTAYAFRNGDLRTSDIQKASYIYRLLCFSGLGGRLTVTLKDGMVRLHMLTRAPRAKFRPVLVSEASVLQVLLIPRTASPLVHVGGLVFVPHML